MAILENVTFCYVKIKNPVPALNAGDTEFTIEAIVDKASAKQWDKDHVKNKAKQVDTDEFETKYLIAPPYPEQENQYVIKFKKIHSKKGVELPAKYRPRVFVPGDDGAVDVTFDVLPANGSTGKVSFSTFEGPKAFPGTFVQLDAILVEEMIEYSADGGGGDSGALPGADFGAKKLATVPANQKIVNKQSEADDEDDEDEAPAKPAKPAAKAAKPAPKPKKATESDDEDDSPF